MKRFLYIFLTIFIALSCSLTPAPEQFAPPVLGDIQILSSGTYGVSLKCPLSINNDKALPSNIQVGFYLLPDNGGEASTIDGRFSKGFVYAQVDDLSIGAGYTVKSFVKSGDYEVISGSLHFETDNPFTDPDFKSYLLENFDSDGDGGMSEDEILAVTKIRVGTDNISTLDGVELFANLSILECVGSYEGGYYGGSLRGLDLSQNHKLEYLQIENNKSISQLSLYNNMNLYWLGLSGTGIKDIDLSSNVSVSYIEAYNSSLSILDLTSNPQVETLKVTGSRDLLYIYVKYGHKITVMEKDSHTTVVTKMNSVENPEIDDPSEWR